MTDGRKDARLRACAGKQEMDRQQHAHMGFFDILYKEISTMEQPTQSQVLIRQVAERIDLPLKITEKVTRRLDEEHLREADDLRFLHPSEWQRMEAPIGLVVAVRKRLQEEEYDTDYSFDDNDRNLPPLRGLSMAKRIRGEMDAVEGVEKNAAENNESQPHLPKDTQQIEA